MDQLCVASTGNVYHIAGTVIRMRMSHESFQGYLSTVGIVHGEYMHLSLLEVAY